MAKVYGVQPADSGAPPSVPTGLSLSFKTAYLLILAWDEAADATLWTVYVNGVPYTPVNIATATIAGLTPSTVYSVQLQASNAFGASALTDAEDITTDSNSPPVWDSAALQTALQALVLSQATSIDLGNFVDEPDGQPRVYTVLSGSIPGLTLNGSLLTGTPSAVGTGSISMRINDGYASADTTVSYAVADPDVTAPTIPGSPTGEVTGSSVELSWSLSTDASGVAAYRVYRNGVFRTAVAAPPFVDVGLPDGAYDYVITAVDASGNANESAPSATVSVTIATTSPGPDVPINLTGQRVALDTDQISWAPGPNGAAPTDYNVQYSLTGAGPWTNIPFSGAGTSLTNSPIDNVDIWYRVQASANGQSSVFTTPFKISAVTGTTRNIYYEGDWDDLPGARSNTTNLIAGGRFKSLYNPQGTTQAQLQELSDVGEDLPKTASNLDLRIVTGSETWQGETITPREGNRFIRHILYYTKNYKTLNGSNPSGPAAQDKPRTYYDLTNAAFECDWDREFWYGTSIYVPLSHNHNVGAAAPTSIVSGVTPRDHRGGRSVFGVGATDNYTQMGLMMFAQPSSAQANYVGGTGGSTEHWMLWHSVLPNAPGEPSKAFGSSGIRWIELGDVADDMGMWTDFVFRLRFNPFSASTNAGPLGGYPQTYPGNKGILQVWKSTGPYIGSTKNRLMTKVVDKFNTPIGCVPADHRDPQIGRLEFRCAVYAYPWKTNAAHNVDPVYLAYGKPRYGYAKAIVAGRDQVHSQFGTVDYDVTPSGLALPAGSWTVQT